jgi:acyl transferase domain-containing protein/thioesterase domain-containing protein
MSSSADSDSAGTTGSTEIAIIGLAGRFPGARNIEEFWDNLRAGVESIRTLSDEELTAAGVPPAQLASPNYVKACPVLEDSDKFDAQFFGISPRDASVMDPAHRFFLEVAWEACEHAGYSALPEEGAVGVFATSGAPLYMMENLRTNPELMRSMGEFLVRHTGNDMSFLATRVSYEMDLRGPSLNIQTACSSALVAVHLACQSLLRKECTLALAGGSTVLVPRNRGYLYQEGEILSPDGHCRPFDADSGGTVFGSGTGCVVLKRLSDALDDGDTIHAVIKGSAINNDGALKVGYLAPGVDGQVAAIESALAAADVPADSISYIEAHGTGTRVGDPIEVEALIHAFRQHTDRRGFCALGSVKSNIGHLGEAAGIAALIKAIMALKQRELPPSLGYRRPNPAIDFDSSPFYVNDRLRPWAASGPLRCGITALGAGGTNCHVILEEAPEHLPGEGARSQQLLVLSARTRSALDRASERLADALEADPALDLADVAYTLAHGRRQLPQRRALAARDRGEAIAHLRQRDPKSVVTLAEQGAAPSVVFMFPGGGAQYARMGLELYEREPVYRDAVDECLALIRPELGRDLAPLLFAPEPDAERATRELERPSLTLPALFTTEYALAKLFMAWGVTPAALLGHSVGEYAAACLSGVLSLRDALRLVLLRGRLFEKVERGGMLSVPLSEAELRAAMPSALSIAAINAPELTVASGPLDALAELEALLARREIESTRIRIDVAAHSVMLEPVLQELRSLCRSIRFEPPTIPYVSNLTGRWITAAQATDPEYWVRHLREPVRFAECLQTLQESAERVLLEVGPGRTLTMLARAQAKPARHTFNSLRHPQESASDLAYALTTLGRIWCTGAALDWGAFYAGQLRNRVPLPSYPFERQSYWVEPGRQQPPAAQGAALDKRTDLASWFYTPSWLQKPLLEHGASAPRSWLVLAHDREQGQELTRAIRKWGDSVVALVSPGEQLVSNRQGSYWLDFRSALQLSELVRSIEARGERYSHVLYLAGRTRRLPGVSWLKSLDLQQALTQSFFAPTYLVRALGGLSENIQLIFVTSQLAEVGAQRIDPRRATMLGPVLVGPREHPQLNARCIDLASDVHAEAERRRLAQQLYAELRAETDERLVALRPGERWVQELSPCALPPASAPAVGSAGWLRDRGVYLITGGLGGIGLTIARHLARQKPVTLALLARSALPPESSWDAICATEPEGPLAARIAGVRELRALGATVRVIAADVTDPTRMRDALAALRAEHGPLHGVVHAAGVMDDEPLQNKTERSMRRVLAPKVEGTLILDELVKEPLDVFVLFSSVASFLGLPGQVDYTAANAFVDAFARERSRRAPGRTLVINWNAWRDVGMAEAARRGDTTGVAQLQPCTHPALDGHADEGGEHVFVSDFSLARHWLLSEHQIKGGSALLPGTAFVELARAAFEAARPGVRVELTNLTFLSPFQVATNETRRLRIELVESGDVHELAMYTPADGRAAPHVVGEARANDRPAPRALDLAAIRKRCDVRELQPHGRYLDQRFVAFGPRWANIARVHLGGSEALIELELDAAFAGDLAGFGLHPALLDMATGGAQALIPGADLQRDFYVPLRYERVRVFSSMPRRSFSHVRVLPETAGELAYFDVTLTDEAGAVIADIHRFTMKRLSAASGMTAAVGSTRPLHGKQQELTQLLRHAIAPAEGMEAFERILAQPNLVQTLASSVDVLAWRAQLDAPAGGPQTSDAGPSGFSRPDLGTDYAPPETPLQRALAEIWSELVGVRELGIDDDFFELGGNSLVAVRLFAAIKRRLGVSLPLSRLFEAPTIRQLAALLEALVVPEHEPAADSGPRLVSAPEAPAPHDATTAQHGYTPLVPIQVGAGVPFFCVHGAGGNVLNFRDLARRLGAGQSFYGLQARGVTGGEPATRIEQMASEYSAAIRALRPSGPYLLGGYSGGGVVAFEMAQQLRAAGEQVLLVLLDTFHPACRARGPSRRERLEHVVAEGYGPYVARTGTAKLVRMLDGLRHDLQIRYYQRLGLPLPWELRELHVTEAFDQAAARYVTQRYDGPVILYKARIVNAAFDHVGPTLGWAEFAPQLDVVEVPGDHKTVMYEPNVDVLIRHLKASVAAFTRGDRSHAAQAESGCELAAQ